MAMVEGIAKVLIVDDEEDFLSVVRALLETQSFAIETASSVGEAMAILKQRMPDAVVCDYMMPGINGIELLKWMHKEGWEVPFILLTGQGREEVVIEAINNGANYYVQKGGSIETLIAELKHKLGLAIKHAADEEELRLSQFSLDNASLAIVWFDGDGGIVRANRAAGELLGCSVEEMLSRNMLEIDIGMSQDRWAEILDICRRLGRLRYDASFLRSTGDMLPVEIELNLFERCGRPCLVGFLRDVQDRKLADEYSGEKLAILEGLQQTAIEYIDADMRLKWTNQTRGPADLPFREPLGGLCYQVLQGRDRPCPGCPAVKAFQSGHPERAEVLDQVGRSFLVSSAPVLDPAGHVIGMVNSSIDVSELKSSGSLEDALRAMQVSVDGIALLRADETYWYVNDAHARIYGYDGPQELLGRSWTILYEGQELDRFKREIMPSLQAEGSWRGESVGKRKDGARFAQELSLTALEDGGLICVVRDVSQRKQIERELETNQHLLNSIMDSSPNLIYIYDLKERRILYANREVASFLGHAPEQTSAGGDGLFERPLHPEDRVKMASYRKEIARQPDGVTLESEFRMRRADGTWRWMRSRDLVFSRDADGSARAELGSAEDITDRKMIEVELQHSEERFRNLVEMADEGIWALDHEQRFVYVNRRAEVMLGYEGQELLGLPVEQFFDPDRKMAFMQGIERHRRGMNEKFDFELIRRDGSRFPVHIAAAPLLDASGDFSGSMAVVVDTSDIIAKEEALERMNKRLNILSSITRHDILNQISVLGGYLELERRGLNPERRAERLLKMASALSSISRQIAFTKDYEEMGVKAPTWQDVMATVRVAAGGLDLEHIDLILETDGLQILADPLLVKVFYNLLENSVKHGGGVTRIEVRAERRQGCAEVVYEDNGHGIPEDQQACLFTRGCGGRSGLGLFLSKEILAITKIGVHEDGGENGARFHLQLPEGVYRFP